MDSQNDDANHSLKENQLQSMAFADMCTKPLPLVMVLLLLLNDHVFKSSNFVPRVISGKLSDFAGLFFFPVFLTCLTRLLGPPRVRERAPMLASLSTVVVFILSKTVRGFNAVFSEFWGHITLDPTDLIALPMVFLAYQWMKTDRPLFQPNGEFSRLTSLVPLARFLSLVLMGVSVMATSPPKIIGPIFSSNERDIEHCLSNGVSKIVLYHDRAEIIFSWQNERSGYCAVLVPFFQLGVLIEHNASQASVSFGERRVSNPSTDPTRPHGQTDSSFVPIAMKATCMQAKAMIRAPIQVNEAGKSHKVMKDFLLPKPICEEHLSSPLIKQDPIQIPSDTSDAGAFDGGDSMP